MICVALVFRDHNLDEDPIAIASFSAMEKGILVSTPAGNNGPYYKTLSNGIPWVLTVASGTIDRWFGGTLTWEKGLNITGWSLFPGETILQKLPLVYNQTFSTCDSSASLSKAPNGIILCDIGNLVVQIDSIVTSDIAGAVLVSGDLHRSKLTKFPCPCLVISLKDAQVLLSYAKYRDPPNVTMEFKKTIMDIKPAPIVSPTSSRGPSKYFPWILKPDVMAPGYLVLGASIPNNTATHLGSSTLKSDYIIGSGTSFACAHVVGVIALLKAAHPGWSPAAIRPAIMTTANPFDNTLNPIHDNGRNIKFDFASPLAMGAGHIDPNKALDPGLVYDATPQDYINQLCYLNVYKRKLAKIIRSKKYSCLNSSLHLNYPSLINSYEDQTRLVLVQFHRTVTNVSKEAAVYKALVTGLEAYVVTVSLKTLEFVKKNDKQSYNITLMQKVGENRKNSFGALVWIEENGNHKVRSPIVLYHSSIL